MGRRELSHRRGILARMGKRKGLVVAGVRCRLL
jgi:hypothetical protein